MQYRRDIDGLRAVAVISVIFFHAGFSIFSGGYVGVDIFFVISGYLITSIIISELDQGTFSILRFYERRARRILPALFFVMFACIPFAFMWMFPTEFEAFSKSIAAVTVFASNILFWRESGYFAAASENIPLLHTWSLAVEEQYYLLFPVFLALLWRFGRSPVFYSIVAISIVSLLLSEWGWRNAPTANFYLAPTRAWELLAGSICAFLQYGKPQKSNNVLSAFGLALIVFAIFFYTESTPFPSVYALTPVMGTALIIMYGAGKTWVGKLLSLKVFVGIGLISYSAYLWHQPLFAFARIGSAAAPEQWLMFLLSLTSLALAYFSWRFVESPFRKPPRRARTSHRAVFSVSAIVGSVFISFGLSGYLSDSYRHYLRFSTDITDLHGFSMAEILVRARVSGGYSQPVRSTIDNMTKLTRFDGNSDTMVYIMGDSHTIQYVNAIDSYFQANENSIQNSTLVNATAKFPPQSSDFPEAFDDRVETVVLSYFWALKFGSHAVNQAVRCCGVGAEGRIGEQHTRYSTIEQMDEAEVAIDHFVKRLVSAGKHVIIILDNPFGEELDPTNFIHIAGRKLVDFTPPPGASRADLESRRADINQRLLKIAQANGVDYIDPFDFLCSPTWCPAVTPDSHFLYKDYDHISPYASENLINYTQSDPKIELDLD
jgi:peptidoglycan/LPS O-acetylase OafA/YrhL